MLEYQYLTKAEINLKKVLLFYAQVSKYSSCVQSS